MSASRGRALGVSTLNLASKGLAIAKTMLISALFGASASLDAFWVAYSLPTLLPAVLTTVITVAFVPRFMASLEGRSGPEAWRGANTLFTLVMLVSVVAAALMSLYAPALVRGLAPGLAEATHAEAVRLTRLLMPCVPLLTCNALLSAISNARERFFLPALEGVFTNLVIIGCALLLARHWGTEALVIGVIGGFVLQAASLLWGNRDLLRSSLRPALAPRHPDFLKPLAHLLPLLVGALGSTLTALVNQYFLSGSGEGAISLMAYALMFAFLPVEVFAQAVLTAYYPALGRGFAAHDLQAAAASYAEGLRFLLLLLLPSALLLGAFAEPLMLLMLERGAFGAEQTRATAVLVQVLSAALVLRGWAYFNYRVLHAAQRPWLQVAIGLLGVATHAGLCALWVRSHGAVGVALATVASMLQSLLLSQWAALVSLRMREGFGLPRELGQLGLLSLLMALLCALALHLLGPLPASGRIGAALHHLAAAAAIGLLVLITARLLRQPDVLALEERLRGRAGQRAR